MDTDQVTVDRHEYEQLQSQVRGFRREANELRSEVARLREVLEGQCDHWCAECDQEEGNE